MKGPLFMKTRLCSVRPLVRAMTAAAFVFSAAFFAGCGEESEETSSGKKSSSSGRNADEIGDDKDDAPAKKTVSGGKKRVWDDDIPDKKAGSAKDDAPSKKKSSAADAEKAFRDGMTAFGKRKYADAVKNFREAADNGHAEAMFKLAVCYLDGKGVRESEIAGVEYLEMAADAGNAKAAFLLLMRDVEERDMDENTFRKKAKKIAPDLLAAAEDDDVEAQALCALLCMTLGDIEGAQKWASKAEANGFDGTF